jgi:hypothetical protein
MGALNVFGKELNCFRYHRLAFPTLAEAENGIQFLQGKMR